MRLSPVIAVVFLCAACPPASTVCTAGKSEVCACPDGRAGERFCLQGGNDYSACSCSPGTDGGNGTVRCGTPEAPDCGAHGTCVNSDTGASCACQTAYTGPACIACATGFQDNNADGTCLPTCATLATTCSGHGTCGDGSGTATCTCSAAYSGPTCGACATGFQDNDADGACTAACQSSSCGAHGTCVDSSGAIACSCATGYTGALCSACAAGYQDHDGDGTCAAACAAGSCPANATCADSTGAVVCTCTAAYTGASCTSCATGYQDRDLNGSCLPTCATAALACAPRAGCDDGSGEARCACLAGYAGADGGVGCGWVGVVRDPGLQGNPAAQWQAGPGVSWTPGAAGGVDPGSATLGGACAYAAFTQTSITLPPMSTPDRLALRVSRQPSTGGANGLVASLGQATAYDYMYSGGWASVDLCLGEAAYGSTQTLSLRSSDVGLTTCSLVAPLALDRVSIEPSAGCPANGTVLNGNLEDTNVGWSLVGGVTVVPNGAVNGSRALRLNGATTCNGVASTWLAVPSAATLASPALRFAASGPAGGHLQVFLSLYPWATVATTGPGQTVTLCLPAATQGQAVQLDVGQDRNFCSPGWTGDVDNFTVVSEPACAGLATNPYNPGFESADLSVGFLTNASSSDVSVDTSSGVAHSGTGALRMLAPAFCGIPLNLSAPFLVPAPTTTSGPAAHFWYRLATAPAGNFWAEVYPLGASSSVVGTTLSATTWTRVTLCLPAKAAGTVERLSFRAPSCGGVAGPSMWVDDLDVSVDPSCPQ